MRNGPVGLILKTIALLMIGLMIGPVGEVYADPSHGSDATTKDISRTITMTMEPNLRFAVDPVQEGVEIISQEPLVVRIDKGTQIVFENTSPFAHNVLHATPENLEGLHGKSAFHSPEEMAKGEVFAYTFTKEGSYPILCMYAGHHLAGMTATILVGDNPPSADKTFETFNEVSHGGDH